MGYYVLSYLTNAEDIKKLFGSKNKELYISLLDKLSEDLEDINDSFEDDFVNGVNAQEILSDFIEGEIRFPELDFAYGYIYEKICEHYGEYIIPPSEEYSTNYYWNVPKDPKTFVNIPFSSDFPDIYSISKSELKSEKNRFLSLKDLDGVGKEELEAEKKDFEYIFDKAIEENKDLIFVVY